MPDGPAVQSSGSWGERIRFQTPLEDLLSTIRKIFKETRLRCWPPWLSARARDRKNPDGELYFCQGSRFAGEDRTIRNAERGARGGALT